MHLMPNGQDNKTNLSKMIKLKSCFSRTLCLIYILSVGVQLNFLGDSDSLSRMEDCTFQKMAQKSIAKLFL